MPPEGSIPGRAATCTMTPEPCRCICGATAWLNHSAGRASRTFRVSAEVRVAEPRVDTATRQVKGHHRIPVIHQTGLGRGAGRGDGRAAEPNRDDQRRAVRSTPGCCRTAEPG